MSAPPWDIVIQHAGEEIARHTLAPGEFTLGRASSSSIPIKVGAVSRQHARLLVAEDGSVQVEDLASANGTLLDEQPIGVLTAWQRGQILRIDDAALHLVASGEAAPAFIAKSVESPVTPPNPDPVIHLQSLHSSDAEEDVIQRHLPLKARESQSYDVGAEVARGGMGAVYQALESATRRTVAMKVMLRGGDAKSTLRFIEEAQVTAQLEHPNIVPVHDLGIDERGQPFYTMKLVSGITLKKVLELLKQRRPETLAKYPLTTLLTLFQKIGDALAFAHSRGVIHRDLKPANIMLGKFGEVMVMDWGLAKIIGTGRDAVSPEAEVTVVGARQEQSEVFSTMEGTIMGTPHYMSPEQARGEVETLDARSDVFALGVILYEILTLERPFSGKNSAEVMQMIIEGRWTPAAERVRQMPKGERPAHLPGGEVPGSLDAIVRQALALDIAHRYLRVQDLQADLTAYQGGFATKAERAGVGKQLWFLLRRRKVESIAAALVLIAGLGFGGKALLEGRRSAKALADLRRQAPAFAEMANAYVEQLNLPAALGKLDAAIQLDPNQSAFHARRGDILQTQLHFVESVAAYDRALALDPQNAAAKDACALSVHLAASPTASTEPTTEELNALNALLMAQQRLAEAVVLTPRLSNSRKLQLQTFVARLKSFYPNELNMTAENIFNPLPDGRYDVDLGLMNHQNERTLEAFRGVPVRNLKAFGYPGSDLSPLVGMPLEHLYVGSSTVSNLRLLHGTPLRELSVGDTPLASLDGLQVSRLEKLSSRNTKISDLTPLDGAPLRELDIGGTDIRDLSPLRNSALEYLDIYRTEVVDLEPLRGKRLRFLNIANTEVKNLEALHGMPIEVLDAGSTHVVEMRPLIGTPLRRLRVGGCGITSLEFVRELPLEYLNLRNCLNLENFEPLRSLKLKGLNLSITNFKDGSVLRGQPLEVLLLARCADLSDTSFLKDLPQLKALTLPDALIESARNLPSLRYLSSQDLPNEVYSEFESTAKQLPTVEQFWKERDARNGLVSDRALTPEHIAKLRAAGLSESFLTGRFYKQDGTLSLTLLSREGLSLEKLAGLPISDLSIHDARLGSVSFVKGLPIKSLNIAGNQVFDILPLKGLPLNRLNIGSTKVTDISPLHDLPLKELYMGSSEVSNLEPLRGMELQILRFPDTAVSDLSPLRNMPLKVLNMRGCKNIWRLNGIGG